jgi:hypothetical protein
VPMTRRREIRSSRIVESVAELVEETPLVA